VTSSGLNRLHAPRSSLFRNEPDALRIASAAFQPFEEISMRKLFGIAVVAGALLVSACNTVEGVGRDVSSAGNTVAKTADGAK
jgi:predicted small secreted protein